MNVKKYEALIKEKDKTLKIFVRTIEGISKTLELIDKDKSNTKSIAKKGYDLLVDLYNLKNNTSKQILTLHFNMLLEKNNMNEVNFWNIFLIDAINSLKRAHGESDNL